MPQSLRYLKLLSEDNGFFNKQLVELNDKEKPPKKHLNHESTKTQKGKRKISYFAMIRLQIL